MRRALLAALAAVLAAATVALGARLSDRSETVGRNVLVNEPGQLTATNSPSLARNPRRPRNIVLTDRVDRTSFSAALHWSGDGGTSWRHTELPLPAGLNRPFAPDVAFAPDGTLFVTYVNLVGNGNVPDNVWLARSTDGGRTLSAPERVAGRLAFQVRLAVGRDGAVFVTWLQAADVALLKLVGSPSPVVLSRSTDGGRTFSAPVPVSDPRRERVGAASPVIDSSGRLVVLYEDYKTDRLDFEHLEGPPAEEPFALVVTSSADGGTTFAPGVELESGVVATRRFLVFLPEFPSLAAGPKNELYVSWADGRHGDDDVFLRRSDDGGTTWEPAVRVNGNRQGDHTSQYLPRVAVAPSGRVQVLFLDRRRDHKDIMTDAFLATSVDGGRTFSNRRLSSRSFDSRVGPFVEEALPVDFGSRLGLLTADHTTVAAWTDSRFGTEGTGRQDIVATRVAPRRPSPPGIAAAAALAFLSGLALALAWRSGRTDRRADRAGGDGRGPVAGA